MTEAPLATRLAEAGGYLADDGLATALSLMQQLQRPLLLEGAAGVGKTEVARALSVALGTRLVRLQCYEGLDATSAIYEWNYQRQLLAIKASERTERSAAAAEADVFSERFLLRRPLLESITEPSPCVLLIDEIDRADEEFEAYLLEVLSEYQVTIPELGTIRATSIPHVILTANGTRELSDALRRRCLYFYVEFPTLERELTIIRRRLPGIDETLAGQIARFVARLREEDLEKNPGIAETLDWAAALSGIGVRSLDTSAEQLYPTLICLLKTQADRAAVTPEVVSRLQGRAA